MNKFKAISDQAVVVLGASSGIGRSTALKFAEKGANLVVAARSTKGIETLVAEIKKIQTTSKSPGAKSAQVEGVICDVADFDQVKNVAKKCFDLYGRIDTWVQPAGITLFASFEDTTEEEMRRVMDVNFLGQCRGAWAALPYLKRNPTGGALIHVGSVESRRAFPYQGAYSSSKHAMEGFTEALRSELKMQNSKVQVTLLMPSNIDTPFYEKCRTKVDDGKYVYTGPAPTYKASHCADAILFAAEYPTRHLVVGDGGWFLTYLQGIAPEIIDKATELGGKLIEKTTAKKRPDDNFYAPIDEVEINRITGVGMHPMPISVYNLWYQNVWARIITYFMLFIGFAFAILRRVW